MSSLDYNIKGRRQLVAAKFMESNVNSVSDHGGDVGSLGLANFASNSRREMLLYLRIAMKSVHRVLLKVFQRYLIPRLDAILRDKSEDLNSQLHF